MKWISVKDAKPDEYEYVLWCDPSRTDGYRYFVGRLSEYMIIEGPPDYQDIYVDMKDNFKWTQINEMD